MIGASKLTTGPRNHPL